MSEPNERTALYRVRGEAEVLLYIGITNHPPLRWNQHQAVQPWWDELRSLTVEWYDSRPEAEDAEKAAILAEQPKYNVTYLKPARLGYERRFLEIAVERGKVELAPRHDDEDLMTLHEVATMARLGPTVVRRTLAQTEGPTGFLLGNQTLFRRGQVRQWIADVEASQQAGAAVPDEEPAA